MIIHGISMLLEFIGAIVICIYGVEESDGINDWLTIIICIPTKKIQNKINVPYTLHFSIDQRVERSFSQINLQMGWRSESFPNSEANFRIRKL